MANIYFNKQGKLEAPTLLLQKRNFETICDLKNVCELVYKKNFNSANEISFKIYKELINGDRNEYWDEIKDCRIVKIPEINEAFEIGISLDEEDATYKIISGTSLAESELSQVNLYKIEINTEDDLLRDEYDANFPTVFYRDINVSLVNWNDSKYNGKYSNYTDIQKENILRNGSLLHRILEKASHYSIDHVDESLKNLQQISSFSIDWTDIYSELTGDIAEEYGILFTFDSVNRTVSAHDLYNTCHICGYRGDFSNECPECGSTDFGGQYGEDTSVYVSSENLSTQANIEGDKDSLKNCFYVTGGDDLMTATVANINPNGSNYIYYFSPDTKADMPEALVDMIESYESLYSSYKEDHKYYFDDNIVANYNSVVNFIKTYFSDTTSFGSFLSPISGYDNLTEEMYDNIDMSLFIQSSMLPTVNTDSLDIDSTIALLTVNNLSPVAVVNPTTALQTSVENAIEKVVKCLINTAIYKCEIITTSYIHNTDTSTWTGIIKLTSIDKESTDKDYTRSTGTLSINVNGDIAEYIKQNVAKQMNSVDLIDAINITNVDMDESTFKERLHYYGLNSLSSLIDSFQSCMTICLQAKEKTSDASTQEICDTFYAKYSTRLSIVAEEQTLRNTQLTYIENMYNAISSHIASTQNALNFHTFLGDEFWNIFCAYRREDNYSNTNYISDGSENAQLISDANQLMDVAKKELYKAGTMQYTITSTLTNLLALPEFNSLKDYFEVGNWIHVAIDDIVYKLRLLSYEINYDNLDSIDVEFSTVEHGMNGSSDIKNILDSATSIAGSYSGIVQQVKNQTETSKYVQNFREKGLDATNTKILSSATNQSVVIDKNGILCRAYDDIDDVYDDCQMRQINGGMYLTSDNWKTLSMAIGKMYYVDPESGENILSYGVNAGVIVGDLMISKALKIYNENSSVIIDAKGITLDGGAITWKNSAPISKISTEYYASTSGASLNGGEWSTAVPTSGDGIYIWTRTVSVDSNNKVTYSSPMCITLAASSAIDGISCYFFVMYSAQPDGSNMSSIPLADTKYMGVVSTNTEVAPTDPTDYTWTLIKGEDGENGTPGQKGEDGRSSFLHIKYSDDGKTFTSNNGETLGKWMGVLVDLIEVDSTNFSDYTWKKYVGENGQDGTDSYTIVLSNENHTFVGTSSEAIANSTTCDVLAYKGFNQVAATIGTITGQPDGMTTAIYDNGTVNAGFTVEVTSKMKTANGTLQIPVTIGETSFIKTFSYSIAFAGTDGDGKNGIGISSIVEKYYQSSSPTELLNGEWLETYPGYKTNYFIWTKSIITYTDDSTSETEPICVSGYGENGNGIQSVDVLYYESVNPYEPMDGEWKTSSYMMDVVSRYIFSKTVVTYSDGTIYESNPVRLSGYSVKNYFIEANTSVIKKTINGTLSPEELEVTSYSTIGGTRTDERACFVITRYNKDGTSKTVLYSSDEVVGSIIYSSHAYTFTEEDNDANFFVVKTYEDSTEMENENALDCLTIPVITDTEAIESITTYYYLSTSDTKCVDGEWAASAPTWTSGKYVWTKDIIVYASGATKETNITCDKSLTESLSDMSDFKSRVNTALGYYNPTTSIGEDYVISPKIGGGYLYISNGTYSVEIDPNQNKSTSGYLFAVKGSNGNVIMGVKTNGDAVYTGKISWANVDDTPDIATKAYVQDIVSSGGSTDIADFKNQVATALGYTSSTQIGYNYAITSKIGTSYLYATNGTYSVEIDPNSKASGSLSGYLFCIRNGSTRIMSVDTSGNAYFKGDIYADGGEIGGLTLKTLPKDQMSKQFRSLSYLSNGSYSGINGGDIEYSEYEGTTDPIVYSYYPHVFFAGSINRSGHDAKWYVDGNGYMVSKYGLIGGFTIRDSYIANGTYSFAGASTSVYIGTDGISCGSNFRAKSNGDIFMKTPYIYGSVYMNIYSSGITELTSDYKKIISQTFVNGNGYPVLYGTWYAQDIYGSGLFIDSGDGYISKLDESGLQVYPLASSSKKTTINSTGITTTGSLNVTGTSKFTGAVNFAGGTDYYISASGGARVSALTCKGAAAVNSLSVTTETTLSSTLTVASTAKFSGAVYFAGGTTYYLSTNGNINANYITAAGTATFNGAAAFNGNVTFEARPKCVGCYTKTYTTAANMVVTSNGYWGRYSSSSRRYKHDIKPLNIADVRCLYDVPLHTFRYNEGYISQDDERYGKDIPGLIAEELDEVLPIAVDHININGELKPEVPNTYTLLQCALALIQDLNNRITDLETTIQEIV